MENDWILSNIKKIIKEKNLKLENVSNDIGKSTGEFSKILNGERKNYFSDLPKIAQALDVDFHTLVKQDSTVIQNNHHQEGGTAIANNINDQKYIDKLVNQCQHTIESKEATIKTLEDLVKNEKEAKENFKRKYEKMKLKVQELEMLLKP